MSLYSFRTNDICTSFGSSPKEIVRLINLGEILQLMMMVSYVLLTSLGGINLLRVISILTGQASRLEAQLATLAEIETTFIDS